MDSPPAAGRRYRVTSRTRRDPDLLLAQREARRRETLSSLLTGRSPETITHEWLADQSGIPLPYLRWRYPTIGDLTQVLGDASR